MTTLQKSILATAALLLLGVGVHQLSSSASPAQSNPVAATPLPGKWRPRKEASSGTNKCRAPSDPRAEERRRSLANLKRRWLAVGNNNARTDDQDALARESVELLSCSPEAYKLRNFLIDHEFGYGVVMMDDQIEALFSSPRGQEARQFLVSTVEPLKPDKQYPALEEWSGLAGAGSPAEEFDEFHASLKNRGCAQEALLGRNFAVFQSDPEAAVRTALRVLESGVHSLSKGDHLSRLFMRSLPEDLDYPAIEQLLPPVSGNRDISEWTPTDWGRYQLFLNWTKADPAVAARFKSEHPERLPEHDRDPIDDSEEDE